MSQSGAVDEKVETFGARNGRPIFFVHGWQLNKSLEIADFEHVFDDRAGWRRIAGMSVGGQLARGVVKSDARPCPRTPPAGTTADRKARLRSIL
jgi:hypothetical protein